MTFFKDLDEINKYFWLEVALGEINPCLVLMKFVLRSLKFRSTNDYYNLDQSLQINKYFIYSPLHFINVCSSDSFYYLYQETFLQTTTTSACR